MELERSWRIVLVDLGHPMNPTTINNVTNSLQNVLALVFALPRTDKELELGISILNSDFAIVLPDSKIGRNFHSINKNLSATVKAMKPNSRLTVQEYRHVLLNSVEAIFQKFQVSKHARNHSVCSLIQIAIVTMKTGSILIELLGDVINKLQRDKSNALLIQNSKIVQIFNEHWKPCGGFQNNTSIDWIFCPDKLYDLNCFFKDWLLNLKQELEILLSKDLNLKIQCEIEDCVINPLLSTDRKCDAFNNIRSICSKNFSTGDPVQKFEITNRLPIHGLSPSLFYGIPRHIYPTRYLEWTESQINCKIFKQLCRELSANNQGLLAISEKSTGKEKLTAFHFLTSDGDALLVNDVAPEELSLPTGARFSVHVDTAEDENAASVIKNCFKKIEYLKEYNPKHFTSGIYDYLRNNLVQEEQSKSLFGQFDPNTKLFGKNCAGTTKSPDYENLTGENRQKRPKLNSEMKTKNTHPALLSPSSQQKYRKIPSEAFNLPELTKDYNDRHGAHTE